MLFLRHPLLTLLTLGYLVLVGWLTLSPQPFGATDRNWVLDDAMGFIDAHSAHWPQLAAWATFDHLEFTANIAMFVPIGLFLVLLFGHRLWWLAILLCVAMTCAIEFSQRYIPGRVSDVRDLESNSLGGLLGVLFGLAVVGLTMLGDRQARQRAA